MDNVFAAILAGGSGTRMGNADKPKQFWDLGGRPMIVHTVEKFCLTGAFQAVLVMVPEVWTGQARDILARNIPQLMDRIVVAAGGAERHDTVECALAAIEERFGLDDSTIIVTHDAVRPFVTYRIIMENIAAAREHGACDTVVPATDTIVRSAGGAIIDEIPERAQFYQGQTPQSFNARLLKSLYAELSAEERASLTDACKIAVLKGHPVALVRGDECNIKVTYAGDMRIARALLEAEGEEAEAPAAEKGGEDA